MGSNVINSVLNSEISKSLFKTNNKRKYGEINNPLTLVPFPGIESEIKQVGNNNTNVLNENRNLGNIGNNNSIAGGAGGNFMNMTGNLNSNNLNSNLNPIFNSQFNSNLNFNLNNQKGNNSVVSNQSDFQNYEEY